MHLDYDWQATLSELNKVLTQEEMAVRLNTTQPRISYLITGRRKAVSHEFGNAILKVCKSQRIKPVVKQKAQSVV